MFIRTERLFLRPGWPEDLDDLLEAFNDDAIQRTVAVTAFPRTRKAVREYLDRPRDPRLPHFFMYLRGAHGAKLVGGIGFGECREGVEIGYWIASGYRGKGYALEALRAVVDQARSLGHRKIIAKHFIDSNASERVLEAAGFRDTGSERLRYSEGRGEEATVRLFEVDLTRRAGGQYTESDTEALSA